MQITVTDHNDWEGEDFSFILEVDEDLAEQISRQESSKMEVQLNTQYQLGEISEINKRSNNGYMQRIGFYEFKDGIVITPDTYFYDEIFYKGCGLTKLKDYYL